LKENGTNASNEPVASVFKVYPEDGGRTFFKLGNQQTKLLGVTAQ
jgi:hypothetical protein